MKKQLQKKKLKQLHTEDWLVEQPLKFLTTVKLVMQLLKILVVMVKQQKLILFMHCKSMPSSIMQLYQFFFQQMKNILKKSQMSKRATLIPSLITCI